MLSITIETSERGDALNWVKDAILNSELELLAFEGYTVKNSKVSMLLDRGCFEEAPNSIDTAELFQTLLSTKIFQLEAKIKFSEKINCPYVFFAYSYSTDESALFHLTEGTAKKVKTFATLKEFAEWTRKYRDLVMSSAYEESGLPKIDIAMRKLGIPWPGNLDYALLKDKTPTALIEFQRTAKASVQSHCNNTWFLPSGFRKGDVNRWLAIDIIRKQVDLPLLVIVWSTNEKNIKLKLVEKIIYPEDPETPKGLRYKKKEMMEIDRLLEILNRF